MATTMESYVQRMDAITLTPEMRAALQQRLARERAQRASTAASTESAEAPQQSRHVGRSLQTRRRFLALAACTAGVALGCAAVGSLWSVTRSNQAGDGADASGGAPEESAGSGTLAGADQPAFVLAAYADGTPVEDRGDTVLAGPGFLDSVGSWDAGPDDDGGMSCHNVFKIDLRAYGDDIVQLDYRIDGDESAQFCYLGSRGYTKPDGSFEEMHGQELTITQDMLERIGTIDGGTFSLEMTFALPDEYRTLYEESHASGDSDEFRFESIAYGAQLLAGRIITVTASFEDGTTLTHEYRIEPVDDFKDALMRNSQAFSASIDAGTTDELVYEPLFTIEQLS